MAARLFETEEETRRTVSHGCTIEPEIRRNRKINRVDSSLNRIDMNSLGLGFVSSSYFQFFFAIRALHSSPTR